MNLIGNPVAIPPFSALSVTKQKDLCLQVRYRRLRNEKFPPVPLMTQTGVIFTSSTITMAVLKARTRRAGHLSLQHPRPATRCLLSHFCVPSGAAPTLPNGTRAGSKGRRAGRGINQATLQKYRDESKISELLCRRSAGNGRREPSPTLPRAPRRPRSST